MTLIERQNRIFPLTPKSLKHKRLKMKYKQIYLIVGSSGQYEDFRTWTVRAFNFKTEALEAMNTLNKKADFYFRTIYLDDDSNWHNTMTENSKRFGLFDPRYKDGSIDRPTYEIESCRLY